MADERLRTLLPYWSGKRGARRMPSRADVDPAELRGLMLLDVIDGARADIVLCGQTFTINRDEPDVVLVDRG